MSTTGGGLVLADLISSPWICPKRQAAVVPTVACAKSQPFADRRQGPSDRYAATVRAPSYHRVRQRMVHSAIFERLLKELHDF